MSHRQGARIQELEGNIKKELERLGIIEVNFYMNNPQKPMVEYRIRENQRKNHCEELKESLTTLIQTNITGIQKTIFYLDSQKDIYIMELVFNEGFGISDPLALHKLLSLSYSGIQNHRIRFGI